jgi:hypothetical protein
MSKQEKIELIKLFMRFLKESNLLSQCGFGRNGFFQFCRIEYFRAMEKLLYGEIDYLNLGNGIKIRITDNLYTENRTISISYASLLFKENDYEYVYEDIELYNVKQYYLVLMHAFFIAFSFKYKVRLPIKSLDNKIIIDKIIKKYEGKKLF